MGSQLEQGRDVGWDPLWDNWLTKLFPLLRSAALGAAVLENDTEDGERSPSIHRFAEDLDDQLARLVADLSEGRYEPRDLTEVVIPKDDQADSRGRQLLIPAVRDRVVERAILEVVTPLVDPYLGPSSFAYRPGLGVANAVQAVAELRDEGLGWAVRTDLDDCFPSLPVDQARRMLAALVPDDELMLVVNLLLARLYVSPGHGRRVPTGLPQGCALSPMLANLVLTHFDQALLDQGFPTVRYADDIVIAATSRDDALEALRWASAAAEELGMRLGVEDTQVMSFDEGFAFLGELFGPRYPPFTGPRVDDPDRRVLYVGLQGARVRVSNGRVLVETADAAPVLDIATHHVGRVVCFGSVGFSAGARAWALSNNVEVVFASRRGAYQGTLLAAASGPRVERVRSQFAALESRAAQSLRQAFVAAKITKQIVLLQRFGRREHVEVTAEAISTMRGILRLIPESATPQEVMGLEGAAAAAYFPAYGLLLPPDLRFAYRSRQPPLDVANSALSFLYTVLLGECINALWAAGLDPAIGILHVDDGHRPSLALDLMEELRPFVVDQVVLEAGRHGRLKSSHGRREDGRPGVLLTRAGREAILEGYERRMLQVSRGALPDGSGSLRRHVYRQAQRTARSHHRRCGGPEARYHVVDRAVLAMIVVAAYDVREDDRRARLAAVLQSLGDRVQQSVFILAVDQAQLDQLHQRAAEIIDPHQDSLYLFRQCEGCWESLACIGQADPPAETLYWAVM